MMNHIDLGTSPWVKLFAPKSVEEMVLPDRIRKIISKGLNNDYLFHGSPGIGKSALARLMCKSHILKYVNASQNGNIESLRSELQDFAMSSSINFDDESGGSNQKVILFDELDGSSQAFFNGLRGFMDEYSHIRYIATCNYYNKLPDAITSRFTCINFNYVDESEMKELYMAYFKRIIHIVKAGELQLVSGEDTKATTLYLIKNNFPDFRTIIQTIQNLKSSDLPYAISSIQKAASTSDKIFDLIFSDECTPQAIHVMAMENYQADPASALEYMGKNVYDYIITKKQTMISKLPNIIIVIADSQSKLPMVIDPLITLKSCMFQLNLIFKSS